MDARQFPEWGKFLSQIGWKIENIQGRQVFIRPIPIIGGSVIKIQRPANPLPFAEIDQIAKQYHALTAIIEPDYENFCESDFVQHGFQKSPQMSLSDTATIKIDLQRSASNLWKSFSENARRNIRKAQANNLTINKINLSQTTNDHEFQQFYKLLSNVAKMKKFFIPGYEEFYRKMLAFKDSSFLLKASLADKVAAVIWIGYYQDTTVYMHVGITEQGYKLLANYLLVWEALQETQKMGFTTFDFEGIFDSRFPKLRPKWVSFTEFKNRFHGQVVEYPAPFVKCYNLAFKILFLCNNLLSR